MSLAPESLQAARRLAKSATAFRTISEVADDLDVPQHVLRFWETKFPQVKPLKRGGGRRYYRPEDVSLLRRVRQLLYQDGYTIKGVQRLLKEGGLKTPPGAPRVLPSQGPAPVAAAAAVVEPPPATNPDAIVPEMDAAMPREAISPELRRELNLVLDELLALRGILDTLKE
jgi:DNA-binding transcriptional MerR regulator